MVGECRWWNVGLYESLRTPVLIGDIVMETCYLFHVYQYMNAGSWNGTTLYTNTSKCFYVVIYMRGPGGVGPAAAGPDAAG